MPYPTIVRLTYRGWKEVGDVRVKKVKGESAKPWSLERVGDLWVLTNNFDEVVLSCPHQELFTRLSYPSFWLSETSLTITGPNDIVHCFKPDPETVKLLKELAREGETLDPVASAKVYQLWAWLTLGGALIGFLVAALAIIAFVLSDQTYESLSETSFFTIVGIAIVAALVLPFYGIKSLRRAWQLQRLAEVNGTGDDRGGKGSA